MTSGGDAAPMAILAGITSGDVVEIEVYGDTEADRQTFRAFGLVVIGDDDHAAARTVRWRRPEGRR
jgi:hypothetical protein